MLLPKHYATRWPSRLGLGAMLVLLVLAWHFYQERVTYYDLAFHLVELVNQPKLFIQNRRFVAAITQLPVLLGVQAGLSLDHLVRLYSVVFVGYYLLVYLLSAKWFRNEQVALVVMLQYVLLAARTFYWAQSELPQALAALLLFYAGVSRQAPLQRRWSTLALAVLVPVAIFGHPLAIFPFLFLWAYDWLLNRRWRDPAYYGLLLLGLLSYWWRAHLIPAGSYEDQGNTFLPNLIQYYPHYLSLGSFTELWYLFRTNFIAVPILLAALTVFYGRQYRDWTALARLALVWSFVAGYAFVVGVANFAEPTYFENLCLPFTIFVAVPFALELLPALEGGVGWLRPALVPALLALMLVLRLSFIYRTHSTFTAYQQWLGQLLTYTKHFPERRFMVDGVNVDASHQRAGWSWWASSFETLIRSASAGPDSAQAVLIASVPELLSKGDQPGCFATVYYTMPSRDLNPTFFRIGNEQAAYRQLNTPPPTDTAALRPYIAARRQTRLELVGAPLHLRAHHPQVARLRISVPAGGQPLHSGTRTAHPTMLRSSFYDASDWLAPVPPTEVPLEVDVWHPWEQDILLNCPEKPGNYLLEISLFSKGYRDWPVMLRVPVEVQ